MKFFVIAVFCLAFLNVASARAATPAVLGTDDIHLYRDIFAAQKSGAFAKADILVGKLSDPLLAGYVREQRYLSPHEHATFTQLQSWLEKYGDFAGADRIYQLALKRKPAKSTKNNALRSPTPVRMRGFRDDGDDFTDTPVESAAAQKLMAKVRAMERDGKPDDAETLIQRLTANAQLPQDDIDRVAAYVVSSYFAEGRDREALKLAGDIIGRGSANAPLCHWTAGLAAYRLGQFAIAAEHFEAIASSGGAAAKNFSGAPFWEARALMRDGHPERVIALYQRAANDKKSYYGMLANQLLGRAKGITFSEPTLDESALTALMQNKAARRAVALWQIGRTDLAEPDLMRAFGEIAPDLDPSFAGLARALGMPSLEMRAAQTSVAQNKLLSSLYPVPAYEPEGGYRIDQAVLLAFARQESHFIADARASSGARGIMQLMPGTAAKLAHDESLAQGNNARLDDPAYSMMLAQNYVRGILDRQDGNLLRLVAAYNAGEGNLSKWMAAQNGNDDPLLFVESIPVAETRDTIKRVMVNMWMYRKRLGEPADDLEAFAAGHWPVYRDGEAKPRL